MSEPDIKSLDIIWSAPRWSPAAHIQAVGRILRPPPMSIKDIHERLLEYLRTGRIVEWTRVKGNVKQVALVLLEDREARLVRVDGQDYLAAKRPNPILQFLSLGSRK